MAGHATHQAIVHQVRAELAAARREVEEFRGASSTHAAEVSALSSQLTSLRVERDALKDRSTSTSTSADPSELAALRQQLQQSQDALAAANTAVAAAKTAALEAGGGASEVSALQRRLEAKEAECEAACSARDTLQVRVAAADTARQQAEAALEGARAEAKAEKERAGAERATGEGSGGGMDSAQLLAMCESLKSKNAALEELMAIRLEESDEHKVQPSSPVRALLSLVFLVPLLLAATLAPCYVRFHFVWRLAECLVRIHRIVALSSWRLYQASAQSGVTLLPHSYCLALPHEQTRAEAQATELEELAGQLAAEQQSRAAGEQRESALRASLDAQRGELDVVLRTSDERRGKVETLGAEVTRLQALVGENEHLHAIIALKDDADVRDKLLQAEKRVSTFCGAFGSEGHAANDVLMRKLLDRVGELEDENGGLRDYTQKLMDDLLAARSA